MMGLQMQANIVTPIQSHVRKAEFNMFILGIYWSFLKFMSYLGLFPCKLVADLQTGVKRLVPIKGCVYLTRCIIFQCFLVASNVVGMTVAKMDYAEIIDGVHLTQTDIISEFGSQFGMLLLYFGMTLHIWNARFDLAKLQDHFQEHCPVSTNTKLKGKITLFFFVYIISLNIGVFATLISMCHQLATRESTDRNMILDIALTFTFYGIVAVIMTLPLLVFQVIFYNVINSISIWFLELKNHASKHPKEQYLKLLQAIRISKSLFSGFLFTFTFGTLLLIIFTAFFSISFIMSLSVSGSNQSNTMAMAIGTTIQMLGYAFIVYTLNMVSQQMTDNVQDLANQLNEEIESESFCDGVMIIEQMLKRQKAKYVVDELRRFQGYDGLGFFTLGKSLLTAILANFTTFFIILIQFKLSENSKEESQH